MTASGSPVNWLSQVTIRTVTETDLVALEWGGEYSHFRRVFAEAFERTQRGLSILWVADLKSSGIIGQVFIQLICDRTELADGYRRAYLYSFRIRPEFRGAGLGSLMIRNVEDDLRYRGFEILTLNVGRDSPRARCLYERHGFAVVAEEPGIWSYIDHHGDRQFVEEPAWRMEKFL